MAEYSKMSKEERLALIKQRKKEYNIKFRERLREQPQGKRKLEEWEQKRKAIRRERDR
jgi:hypothetical protein